MLPNGMLLELINIETIIQNKKVLFDTLEKWYSYHNITIDKLKIYTSNLFGIDEDVVSNGYNLPPGRAYEFPKYIYSLVKEVAPTFLKSSEELKSSFNALIDTCTKYSDELYYDPIEPIDRYRELWMNKMGMYYPGRFTGQDFYSHFDGRASMYKEWNDKLAIPYKSVYDIVKPVVKTYMANNQRVIDIIESIQYNKSTITENQSNIERYNNNIKECNNIILQSTKQIKELESELIEALKSI